MFSIFFHVFALSLPPPAFFLCFFKRFALLLPPPALALFIFPHILNGVLVFSGHPAQPSLTSHPLLSSSPSHHHHHHHHYHHPIMIIDHRSSSSSSVTHTHHHHRPFTITSSSLRLGRPFVGWAKVDCWDGTVFKMIVYFATILCFPTK